MLDLLPPNATAQERALSLAGGRDVPNPIKRLWSPDTCAVETLPWLAWALSVDEWDPAWSEADKRAAIKESVGIHRVKGTLGALRSALQRLGYEVEINDKTGEAYTFSLRVRVNEGQSAGGAIVEGKLNDAIAIALRHKNARSYLATTQFFAEGGTAPMWIGGAPVSGIEVEIKSNDPLSLALDSYETGMIGSYWTVRMHADYVGPIGRVQRVSDNAILSYTSVQELRDFVGVSDWYFLGLFNQVQSVGSFASAYADQPKGEFDANGIPRMLNDSAQPKAFLTFSFPAIVFSQGSLITASAFTSGLNGGSNETGIKLGLNDDLTLRYFNLNTRKERAAVSSLQAGAGTGYGLFRSGKLAAAAAARISGVVQTVQMDGLTGSSNAQFSNPTYSLGTFGPAFPTDPSYGAAAWGIDIGSTAAAAANLAVEAALQF